MAFLNFFKTPKNQKYNYVPRYWDPKKEELQDRLEKYKGKEGKNDVEAVKARLSRGLKRGSGGGSFKISAEMRAKENSRSNKLLLLVVVFLLFLTYIAFKVYVPSIVEALE